MDPNNILTVVMPVYNEESTIITIVENVLARPEVGELIIVNDASKDNSWEKLQTFAGNPKVRLLNQEVNRGKGAALIRGFSEATMPFVMIQDADFEYTSHLFLGNSQFLTLGIDCVCNILRYILAAVGTVRRDFPLIL